MLLEAAGIGIGLESIFGNYNEAIAEGIIKRRSIDVARREPIEEPIRKLFHFLIMTCVDASDQQNSIKMQLVTKGLETDDSVSEVLAGVETGVVGLLGDTLEHLRNNF
jgi:hypothetical protein